ncbi:MAG: hypothetical protein U9Q66_03280 [Patescibacteria group bacterium]|nr:hypothetical protein [Patescibacteria group bacterium]
MLTNLKEEKNIINNIILKGINEIVKTGMKVSNKSLGQLEDDFNLFLRALQLKNRIYDYAVHLEENGMANFKGTIVYNFIDTTKMELKEASEYEEEIIFTF